jgi:hypothetical protein
MINNARTRVGKLEGDRKQQTWSSVKPSDEEGAGKLTQVATYCHRWRVFFKVWGGYPPIRALGGPSMEDNILAIYGRCADFLTALPHAEDRQQNMTDADVMTTALVAMVFCGGNFEPARARRRATQYMPRMLSRGCFNRRWHLIHELFVPRFHDLGETWKELNVESVYVMDRFPVARCDHDRLPRAKLSQQEV